MLRRYLGILLLGALILAAPVAAATSFAVKTPMQRDLDGGGYGIANVTSVVATGFMRITQPGAISGPLIFSDVSGDVAIYGGSLDPASGAVTGSPGSLYLRHVSASAAELWFKFGPADTDWQRLSP